MAGFTALYDACVLYPAPLRDLPTRLALTDRFRAKWSQRIHEEWMRNVLARRTDLSRRQLERTRGLMDRSVRDCLVEGYEGLIPALALPDPDDRHVLAAAIHARAEFIVTYNLEDFPRQVLGRHGLEAQRPEGFVCHLIELVPGPVLMALRAHRASLKNPPKSADEYLATLERQSLPETAASLRAFADLIQAMPIFEWGRG